MTAAALRLRTATAEDAVAVGRLTERAYRDGGHLAWDDGSYATELRDAAPRIATAEVVVAETAGRIVAGVTLALPGTPFAEIAEPDELEVRMLAVAPEARRQGLARTMMLHAAERALAAGLSRVVLSTEPTMHAAHRLYEALGYERRPERDWHPTPELTLLVYRSPVLS